MSKLFPNLCSPGRIGSLDLKNRIVKAPQSTGMSNMDGSVSDRLIRYYQEQARGGSGLIVVEYAYVDKIASKSAHCQLGICDNEHIPGLAWLAETIQDEGSVAGIQIEHCGRQKFLGTKPIKSASASTWPALFRRVGADAVPEALTPGEIRDLVEAFGDAAIRAVSAGFQLIEIHGAHGYLITNFLSPHTNKRTDIYGGSLENRMRFLVEIVENIRGKIGPGFPLTVRLSGTDYEPDGFGIEETIEVSQKMEHLGLDAIHVSGGDHHQMIHQVSPMMVERAHNVWAAEAIKNEIGIPVIASGSITTPDLAESIIRDGLGDFVGLGRPLWADPYFPIKAAEDRPEDIRPCIRCNEGCLERTFFRFKAVTCAVNPTIGREGLLEITPAEEKKRVAVVGGGPAGMEAARVLALRGHDVTLFEKGKLGGALHEASAPNFKEDIRFFMDYLVNQARKSATIIEKAATLDEIKDRGFHTVVVATGARPIDLDIPGKENPIVKDVWSVLHGTKDLGKSTVIVGGGLVGVEVALVLNQQGIDVTIVEMLPEIMSDCATTDKIAYAEAIATKRIKVHTRERLTKVLDDGVEVEDAHQVPHKIRADSVFLAMGYCRNNGLVESLKEEEGIEVHQIGGLQEAREDL
jgi:2,4-dienoyl-CoA reductase-like NADH-dependent reductase (Old Yellow Enzyme family)/thioredoxin reductase